MIYFVQLGDLPYMKVGFTNNVKRRMSCLQTSFPLPLRLLATLEGNYDTEEALHVLLRPWRERGEWFAITPQSIDAIGVFVDIKAPGTIGTVVQPHGVSESESPDDLHHTLAEIERLLAGMEARGRSSGTSNSILLTSGSGSKRRRGGPARAKKKRSKH